MIETSQFQTLVAVANAASFSKAAEELGVTQSAISQSIKNLEAKVGVALFKRSGKRVVLTLEGEKLFGLAKNFLNEMEETLDEIHHDKESMSGRIRVGTLFGLGKSWVAHELMELALENPELSVTMELGLGDSLLESFKDNKLDVLILPEYFIPPVGERMLLGEEKITLVVPASGKYPIREDMSLEELTEYPIIAFENSDPLFLKWCKKFFKKTPKKLKPRIAINSHGHMMQAVVKGLGVAVVPSHVLERSHHKKLIDPSYKNYEVSNGEIYLLHHKDAMGLLRIKTLISRLKLSANK